MHFYLLCYLAVSNHVEYIAPNVKMIESIQVPQCDVMVASVITDESVDDALFELAIKYNVDETPLISIEEIQ